MTVLVNVVIIAVVNYWYAGAWNAMDLSLRANAKGRAILE